MFHPGNPDPLTAGDVAPILLSFMMCTALAMCCDDWVTETMPSIWWRLAEAAACAVAVALATLGIAPRGHVLGPRFTRRRRSKRGDGVE